MPPPQSAHQWSVAELTRLNFDGDCSALAQYVDALVDNNRETENGNPTLLRQKALSDLVDFIGEDSAAKFVDGLTKHLASSSPTNENNNDNNNKNSNSNNNNNLEKDNEQLQNTESNDPSLSISSPQNDQQLTHQQQQQQIVSPLRRKLSIDHHQNQNLKSQNRNLQMSSSAVDRPRRARSPRNSREREPLPPRRVNRMDRSRGARGDRDRIMDRGPDRDIRDRDRNNMNNPIPFDRERGDRDRGDHPGMRGRNNLQQSGGGRQGVRMMSRNNNMDNGGFRGDDRERDRDNRDRDRDRDRERRIAWRRERMMSNKRMRGDIDNDDMGSGHINGPNPNNISGGSRISKMPRIQGGDGMRRQVMDGKDRTRNNDMIRDRGDREMIDRERDPKDRDRRMHDGPSANASDLNDRRPVPKHVQQSQQQQQPNPLSVKSQHQDPSSTNPTSAIGHIQSQNQQQLVPPPPSSQQPQPSGIVLKAPLPPNHIQNPQQQSGPPPGWPVPTPEMLSQLPFPPFAASFPFNPAAAAAVAANGMNPNNRGRSNNGTPGPQMRPHGGSDAAAVAAAAAAAMMLQTTAGRSNVPPGNKMGMLNNNNLGIIDNQASNNMNNGIKNNSNGNKTNNMNSNNINNSSTTNNTARNSNNTLTGVGGRHKHYVLLARNIPEDKMMIGPIIMFFQRFGNLQDVIRVKPDKAFILFERRESASAASNSVDAIMGNRHIRLQWARDNDFADASLQLTPDGKLVAIEKDASNGDGIANNGQNDARNNVELKRGMGIRRGMGRGRGGRHMNSGMHGASKIADVNHNNHSGTNPNSIKGDNDKKENEGNPSAPNKNDGGKKEQDNQNQSGKAAALGGVVVDTKAAAEDLKRKKEKIVALRKEQEARRAQLQTKYEGLVKQQKELLQSLGNVSSDKKAADDLKTRFKEIQKEALQVRAELRPSKTTSSSVSTPTKKPSGIGISVGMKPTDGQDKANDHTINKLTAGGPNARFNVKPNKGSFIVDNRPKNMLIVGCDISVTMERAKMTFRDTARVAKVEEGWLIEFNSRWAAESAMRAFGPLKRGFGDSASSQIVDTPLPLPVSTAKKNSDDGKNKSDLAHLKMGTAAVITPINTSVSGSSIVNSVNASGTAAAMAAVVKQGEEDEPVVPAATAIVQKVDPVMPVIGGGADGGLKVKNNENNNLMGEGKVKSSENENENESSKSEADVMMD